MRLIKNNFEEGYHENILYRERLNSQRNRSRLKVLRQYKQAGDLLEIGCGQAGFLRMAEMYFDVEGKDISNHAIESIRPHFGDRVSVYNVEKDQLPAHRYDVIVVFNILEHLQRPDIAIEKIAGALKPQGLVIGSVPNNSGPLGSVVTRVGNFFDRTHTFTYPPQTWRELFTQAGFTQVAFFGEVLLGRNRCQYVYHNLWPYASFNLMFVCHIGQATV